METTEQTKPNVYIPLKIQDIIEWLRQDHAVMEWSVLWRVNNIDDKLVVTDIFIPKQKNQSAYTEMDNPSNDLLDFLISNNRINEISEWRLWLHSHQKMTPFWSGTDSNTRRSLCSDVFYDDNTQMWWTLSIVIWTKWWAAYHWTIDVYKWEKNKWVQYSQDINVITWLWDVSWFNISDNEINEYINSLWLTWYDNSFLNMFPKQIRELMSKSWIESYNNNIEMEKQRYINYKYRLYKTSKDLEEDQKLIDLWYMSWTNTLEFYVEDLKVKEKQHIAIFDHSKKKEENGRKKGGDNYKYASITRNEIIDFWIEYDFGIQKWTDWAWFEWTFREAQKYVYNNSYENDSLFDIEDEHYNKDTITTKDVYEAWFIYAPNLGLYRNPYTWTYMTLEEAKDYIDNVE